MRGLLAPEPVSKNVLSGNPREKGGRILGKFGSDFGTTWAVLFKRFKWQILSGEYNLEAT